MQVRSSFFKLVVSGIAVCGLVVVLLNFMSYRGGGHEMDMPDEIDAYVKSDREGDILIRVKADVKSSNKPAILTAEENTADLPKVHVRTYMISMNHDQDQSVLVREAGDSNFHILLLHGKMYSSKTWEKLGTLQYLASWGYRALAIDLPGYGNSSLPVIDEKTALPWLTRLIRALRLSDFVIVSPSMSGRFALPYVIQSTAKQQSIRGFVPIAPVGTENYQVADFKHVTIPTWIVHGENDTKFYSALEALKNIPGSETLIIKNASHACYTQQPLEFHNGLRQFLYNVYRPIYIEQYKNRVLSSANTSTSVLAAELTEATAKKREKNATVTATSHKL